MDQVIVTVELHESIIKCQQEIMFIAADPEKKSCHGIVTVSKAFDIDNERMDLLRISHKRRAASSTVVVNELKGKRYECGFCGMNHVRSTSLQGTLPAFTRKALNRRNVTFARSKLYIPPISRDIIKELIILSV